MTKTAIEWTDEVWNPVTGCSKVSQGCKHCYAERLAGRFWGERKFTDVRTHPEKLGDPLRWKKPRRVFVNSMSDLFHPAVPDEFIHDVFSSMLTAPQHTYMILTKRPERMNQLLSSSPLFQFWWGEESDFSKDNIWLGVSVENQQAADERVPLLLQTPAGKRFLSCEPLLGPVDLKPAEIGQWPDMKNAWMPNKNEYDDWKYWMHKWNGIQWVICGGESGPGARPMHPDWARGLRDQCQAAGVPFFFKQWGEYHPAFDSRVTDGESEPTCAVCGCTNNDPCEGGCYWTYSNDMNERCSQCTNVQSYEWPDGKFSYRVGKKTAGHLLDGVEYHQFPE